MGTRRRKDSAQYEQRYPTGWTEQVMLAVDKFTAECAEADRHNDQDIPTLGYAFSELVIEAWNKGFKPSEIKACLAFALRHSILERSDDDNRGSHLPR